MYILVWKFDTDTNTLLIFKTFKWILQPKPFLRHGKAAKCDACFHHFIMLTFPVCNSVYKCHLPLRHILRLLWLRLFALQIGHAGICSITSSQFAFSALPVTFRVKSEDFVRNLILPRERPRRSLWTQVSWSPATVSYLKIHHMLSLSSLISFNISCPLRSESLQLHLYSVPFPSPHPSFFPSLSSSLAFFTSSLAIFSRVLRHHYSVRWLTFHPLSY